MPQRDIIVIGGSGGSLESLITIVGALPRNFPASIFIVIHMPADAPGLLPEHLACSGPLPAVQAVDGETIRHGRIYVARPDHHLVIDNGRIRVMRGPRENRHRPAIDPLFRTAARVYGPRVIGVILSGRHDDGSAGLYAVKKRGGVAIVQEPGEASWSEMPREAAAYANPQFVLSTQEIAAKLKDLARSNQEATVMAAKKTRVKNGRKRGNSKASLALELNQQNLQNAYSDEGEGTPSVFACPECHGVLWEVKNGDLVKFRCRVGHTYGTESLREELSEGSEAALWAAMRALEEKAAMQRRVAEGLGDQVSSMRLRDQSAADDVNARIIRDMIFQRDAQMDPAADREKKRIA